MPLLGLDLAQLLTRAIALLIAIPVHEFAHAWAAYRLGDPTAKQQGRLSLNPLVHLDVLGTLMLLAAGFGWGRPVPVNPYNFRGDPRAGMARSSFAGPLSNLVVAGLFSVILRLDPLPNVLWKQVAILPSLGEVLFVIVVINISLAIFNLIPLAPLDGFSVAVGVLPARLAMQWARLERYGSMILIGLLLVGRFLPVDPIGFIIRPFINLFLYLFLGIRF